ncbi:hypothetical protein ACFW6N_36050 [Streptomyces cyaneofuscatus]|uniref:hypothetical protein n=1 Tax=Streptomyces cyaneofuscatus TaxID=66883 RepID=UPI003412BB95
MASEEELFASGGAERGLRVAAQGCDVQEGRQGCARGESTPVERLRAEAEAELLAAAERLVRVSGLAAGEGGAGAGWPGSWGELLPTLQRASERAGELIALAQQEILLAWPGPEPLDTDGLINVPAAGPAGLVESKCLYGPSADDRLTDQDRLNSLVERGAQVRLASTPFPQMIIVDSRQLLIGTTTAATSGAGCHITDPAVVSWAREVFLMLWSSATRWQDRQQVDGTTTTTGRQRRILRALEAGGAQNDIGSYTGMKQRTVERELLALRSKLGGWNMYQVMAWWGRSPERDLL